MNAPRQQILTNAKQLSKAAPVVVASDATVSLAERDGRKYFCKVAAVSFAVSVWETLA